MNNTSKCSGVESVSPFSSTWDMPVDTLGDLAKAIAADLGITEAIRSRVVRDLERLFRLDPTYRFARPLGIAVEPMLARLHPTRTDLSQKRLDNIKASVRLAIRRHHKVQPGATGRAGLRGAWAMTYALLPPPRNPARVHLSRLFQWLQTVGIPPKQITDETLKQYHAYVRDILGELKPLNRIRMVVKHWNASTTIAGWPSIILSFDTPARPELATKDATMGPRLVAELQDYLHHMRYGGMPGQERDPFDLPDDEDWQLQRKSKQFRPARETTIEGRRFTLRRAIGLLATASNTPPSQLCLRDLTISRNASAILKEYRRQLGGNAAAPACETMAYALVQLGRYHKVDAKAQWQLDELARKVSEVGREASKASGPSKMTAKNLARLKQIGPDQVRELYRLPAVLLHRVGLRIKQGRATTKDMVDAQIAVVIAILLHVPLRAANTVSLEIGRQLILPATDSEDSILHLEHEVVKNDRTLDFRLPPDVTAFIRKYMTEIQPYFARTRRSPALFPGADNPHKTTTNLGDQIAARVQTAIGVTMNQHLFRHLAALLYLRRNPGEYAAVQRLLGHKSLKTTLEYYCGAEIDALLAHVSASMAKMKAEMGLHPDDMSRLIDGPKRRGARKTAPKGKPKMPGGFFSQPASLTVS